MDLAQLNLLIKSDQVQQATTRLNQMTSAGAAAESQTNKLGSASDGLGRKMGSLVSWAVRLATAYGAARIAQTALQQAGKFEQLELGFTTLLHSAESAKAMIADIQKFAAETPFEFDGLASATKQLIAMQFAADQALPILKVLGDTASALNTGQEGVDRMILALGQMKAKGKISAEEMNQLLSANVNGWKYLADAAGKSISEVQILAEKGMLDAGKSIDAILAGMQKDFAGGMALQSKTLLGLFSTFKDELSFALKDIGKTLIDAFDLKAKLATGIEWVHRFGTVLTDIIRVLAGLEPRFAANKQLVDFFVTALRDLAVVMGIIIALKVAGAMYDFAKGAFATVVALIKLWPLLIALVALLTTLVAFELGRWAVTNFRGFQEAAVSATAEINKAVNTTTQTIKGLLIVGQHLKDFAAGRGFDKLGMALELEVLSTQTENFNAAMDAARNAGMGAIAESFGDAETKGQSFTDFVKGDLQSAMSTLIGQAKELASSFGLEFPGLDKWKKDLDAMMQAGEAAGRAVGAPGAVGSGTLVHASEQDMEAGRKLLRGMILDQQTDLALIGKTKEEQERIKDLYKAQEVIREHHLDQDTRVNQMLIRYEAELRKLQQLKQLQALADDVGKSFADAFADGITGAKKFGEALRDLVSDIEKMVIDAAVKKPIAELISAGITGIGARFIGGGGTTIGAPDLGSGLTTTLGGGSSAMGNLFSGGRLTPFANGGVVWGPTMFPTRGGMGLMGERGPEAVMPLARDASGRLGIRGGGGGTTNNVVVKVYGVTDTAGFNRSRRQIAAATKRSLGG